MSGWLRHGALWCILALGLGLAWIGDQPPSTRARAAPATSFSAARAMDDVRVIGSVAHPSGSEAIEAVRRHVLARLGAVGASAEIHSARAAAAWREAPNVLAAAEVQNVVGVLTGRDRARPAVLVMAHYDSVAASPGAADDGAGVATMIEIARSLAASARIHGAATRDVIFLATDAEEAGLLGAHAFFEGDPLARRIGLVVNLEARGDAGRAAMFETGPDDGALIRVFAEHATHPYANSLASYIARILPNDTDFSVARAHALSGFNFAFLGDELAYHTGLATAAHLDPRSVQSLGDQALPLVEALSRARVWPVAAPDWAYGDVLGRVLLGYPALEGGAALLAVCALLGMFAAWRARSQRLLSFADAARGGATALCAAFTAALGLHLARGLLGEGSTRHYQLLVRFDLLFAGCALLLGGCVLGVYAAAARGRFRWWIVALGVVLGALGSARGTFDPVAAALGLGVAGAGFVALRRPVTTWGAWFGGLVVGCCLALGILITAPPAAPVVEWPLALAAFGAALVFAGPLPRAALALAAAAAVLAVGLVGDTAAGVFVALGASKPEILAAVAFCALPALAPFVRLAGASRAGWAAAAIMTAAGAAAIGLVGGLGGAAGRPAPTQAFFLSEPDAHRAWRAAPRLDRWTRQVLGPHPQQLTLDTGGAFGPRRLWATPSPPDHAPAPTLTARHEDARLVITVRPGPRVRSLTLRIGAEGGLTEPRLDARPVVWRAKSGVPRAMVFEAPPPEGFTLSFAAPVHGAVAVAATAVADGWPPGVIVPAKPPELTGWLDSDTSRRRVATRLAW